MAQLIQVTIVWDRSDASAETSRAVSTTAHCQRLRNAPHTLPPAGLGAMVRPLVLPAGRNGTLFMTRALKQASDRSDLFGPKVATDPEVVLGPRCHVSLEPTISGGDGRVRRGYRMVSVTSRLKGVDRAPPGLG